MNRVKPGLIYVHQGDVIGCTPYLSVHFPPNPGHHETVPLTGLNVQQTRESQMNKCGTEYNNSQQITCLCKLICLSYLPVLNQQTYPLLILFPCLYSGEAQDNCRSVTHWANNNNNNIGKHQRGRNSDDLYADFRAARLSSSFTR